MNQSGDNDRDSEVLDEYDFSAGVRGKYIDRFPDAANVVILDADVAKVFSDSEAVNQVLRSIIESHRQMCIHKAT